MPYIGNQHNVGDHVNNFKVLDDISSHTATFDGSATSVVSTTNNTIRVPLHRFIQGQRVTYTHGGGGNIGGLTSGTAYFVSFDSANTIKLATSLANANSNTVINLSSVGSGTSHTLNAAFDGVNKKFKMTYSSGKAARLNNATQLNVAINNVIQRPNIDSNNFTDGFALEDNHKIVFKVAPTVNDVFWGSIIANTIENFDLRDNEVDNFTGDGTTTEFSLSTVPANNESVIVSINGVVQHPSDKNNSRSYTLIDSIIQFTAAPALNDEIQVRHIGFAGASTNDVSGFYGRTGNVALTSSDHITTGDITARNFKATGITTFGTANFASANFSGNVSIGGTLTYEDVTNIDSVGIITAAKDIHVGAGISAVGVITGRYLNPSSVTTQNVIIGWESSARNVTGSWNVLLGRRAGEGLTSGGSAVCIGANAGQLLGSSSGIFIGGQAGARATGNGNVFIGMNAGSYTTSAGACTIIGTYAGIDNQGSNNTIVGNYAGRGNSGVTDGAQNTFIGAASGFKIQGGDDNTGLGYNSLKELLGGNKNVAIGRQAGDALVSGNNNIIIGYQADASTSTTSNEITLGDANINHLRIPGIGVSFNSTGGTQLGITTISSSGNALIIGAATNASRNLIITADRPANADLGNIIAKNTGGNIAAITFNTGTRSQKDDGIIDFKISPHSGQPLTRAMRLTNGFNLIFGITEAHTSVLGSYSPKIQLESTSVGASSIFLNRDGNDGGGSHLFLGHGRGGNGVVQDGDNIGNLMFVGGTGSNFRAAANISCSIDVPSGGSVSNTSMPGALIFSTSNNNQSSPVEAMRIRPDGRIVIGGSTAVSFTPNANADELVIGATSNTNRGITILSGASNRGSLYFADTNDNDVGQIDYNHGDNSMIFTVNAGERLRITSSGQMGLGMVPSRMFEVKDSSGANRIVNVRGTSTSGAFVAFLDANTTDDSKCRVGSVGGNNIGLRGDAHYFQDGGGNNRMIIDSGGRVQVGATNNTGANTKLVLGSGNNINTTCLINTGDVDVDALTLSNWDGSTTTNKVHMHFDASGIAGFDVGIPAATAAFEIRNTSGGGGIFRMASTGAVNIGDTVATSQNDRLLQIGKTNRSATYLELRTSTSGVGGIVLSDGTGSGNEGYRGTIEYVHNGDYLLFKTAASERLRINNEGALSVQTTLTGNNAILYLNNKRTRASGHKYGIEFRDNNNEANANIVIQQNSSGNNAAEMQFYLNGGTGGNGLQNGNHTLRLQQSGDVQIPTGNLNFRELSSSSAQSAPASINLGGSHSNAAGNGTNLNAKLKVWSNGTDMMGMSVSSNQFDFIVTEPDYDYVWYAGNSGTTEMMRLRGDGNLTLTNGNKLNIDAASAAGQGGALLNIGWDQGTNIATKAIDIGGGWSAGENKRITFSHSTGSNNLVGEINSIHYGGTPSRTSPHSGLRFGKLYHNNDSTTFTMTLDSTSTTTADLNLKGAYRSTKHPAFCVSSYGNNSNLGSLTKLNYAISGTGTANNDGYDTTNNRFVAPVDGFYHFYARHWFTPGYTGTAWLYFYRNGSQVKECRLSLGASAGEYNTMQLSTTLYLVATNYIEVYAQGSGSSQFHPSGGSFHTEFSGFLVC